MWSAVPAAAVVNDPMREATLPDGQSSHVGHAQIARRANLSQLGRLLLFRKMLDADPKSEA
jgi:hypothetical protein